MFEQKTIYSFISELADATPLPGGGAVAALNGALSAGLVIMVARITIKGLGKKKTNSLDEEKQKNENISQLNEIIKQAEELKKKLLTGMDEDVKAYEMVVNAYKLPKNTEEEKEKQDKAILSALKVATLIPLQNAEMASKIRELVDVILKIGKKSAFSDSTVARFNAETAINGALANVQINLNDINDEEFKKDINLRVKNIMSFPSFKKI